jgi:hypothetical protein
VGEGRMFVYGRSWQEVARDPRFKVIQKIYFFIISNTSDFRDWLITSSGEHWNVDILMNIVNMKIK